MRKLRLSLILLIAFSLFLAACKPALPQVDPAKAVAMTMAAAQGTFEPVKPANEETAVAQTISAAALATMAAPGATTTDQGDQVAAETPAAPIETLQLPQGNLPAAKEGERRIILWIPPAPPYDSLDPQAVYNELQPVAQANQLTLLLYQGQDLLNSDLDASVQIVISSAYDEALLALATQSSTVKFLSLKSAGTANRLANLFALNPASGGTATAEQKAFVAGFLLGLLTPDYRVGVISQANTDAGLKTEGGFTVGAQYYCGLCNARTAPMGFYPKIAQITNPATDWQAAADSLLSQTVTAVYIQPEVSSSELINYLRTKGVTFIGVQGQAGLTAGSDVIALISEGSGGISISSAVESLLTRGTLDFQNSGALMLTDINPDLLSEGKQAYFEPVLEKLLSGLINPLPTAK